jgi:CRP-like cAMP-binding protein
MGRDRLSPEIAHAVGVLRTVPPFSDLAPSRIARVIQAAKLRPFARDELLVRPGDPPERLLMVLQGLVWVGAWTPHGHCVPFGLRSPVALIGALGLLDGQCSADHARALSDGTAAVLPFEMLRDEAERSPRFGLALGRLAVVEARAATHALAETRFMDVPGRLARRLFALADRFGVPGIGSTGPELTIDLELRHQDVADIVGTSRETASKALARFSARGWIRADGRRIVFLNEPALRRIAGLQELGEGDVADLA